MPRGKRTEVKKTEPAYSIIYQPEKLEKSNKNFEISSLLEKLEKNLTNPLNESQKKVFENSFSERITLLWGPPGTGKSKTLGAIILGWLENAEINNKTIKIAIGSSNWTAIDNLLDVISEVIQTREERVGKFKNNVMIHRLKGSDEVEELQEDKEILNQSSKINYTDAKDEISGIKLHEDLYKNENSVIVGATWKQLNKLAKNNSKSINHNWFDLVLIDESSQVKVAQTAQYLLLMKEDGNIIFAGDDKQLGPINKFKITDDKNGLFDCIFTFMKDTHNIKPVSITNNYRSNIHITSWPKERFYIDGFEAVNHSKKLNLKLPSYKPEYWNEKLIWNDIYLEILNPEIPVTVITYPESTYTVSNPFESQLVTALSYLYKNSLIEEFNEKEFFEKRLGIVTPHRAQKSNIQNQLISYAGFSEDVKNVVDTVDRFQGQERDLIIASYVVSDRDFVSSEEDFILDSRRFNVALTRAKAKFILIISDAILSHLPNSSEAAKDGSHLQLFVEEYCKDIKIIDIPFKSENGDISFVKSKVKGIKLNS